MSKPISKPKSKAQIGQDIMERFMSSEHPVKRKDIIKELMDTAHMTKAYASTFYYSTKKKILDDET